MNKVGKELTYTHFSDIVRVCLLAKYGGAWIDSTCFCTGPIPPKVWKYEFYSCKTLDMNLPVVANGKWVTWFLVTGKNHTILFEFCRDMLFEYWEKENVLIDYLYIDYVIAYAYEHFRDIKEVIDRVPENNLNRNEMMYRMSEKYEKNKLLYKEDDWIYKISYKKSYLTEAEGNITFWKALKDGLI